MNWASLSDFLAMGGYGLYVWGSYVVTAATLVWEVALLVQRRRRALQGVRDDVLIAGARHETAP